MNQRAVFLDRDGTLNEDPGYLNNPDQLRLLPQVGEALAELKKAGFLLIVVSNQSGIARGLIQPHELDQVHRRLDELLRPWAVHIDHYFFCTHHPDDQCECRKPKPKMILDGLQKFQIDPSHSYMVGDRDSDLQAGLAAGLSASILIKNRRGKGDSVFQGGAGPSRSEGQGVSDLQAASFIGESLWDAARWILARETEGS